MKLMLLSYFKKTIGQGRLGKSIAIIAGGTAFAQALGVIFSPIITRIYPPEQYGGLTAFMAVLSLLTIAASLDYQRAIPIAEDDEKAINILALSLFLLGTVVLIITIMLALTGDNILELLNSQVLSSYKYLIPIGVFFAGAYDIMLQWGFRERNYKLIARTRVSQSIAANITKVIFGLMKLGPVGLVLGAVIGQSAGLTSLSSPIFKNKKLLSSIRLENIKYVLKRYKNFPLYSAPSNYVYIAGSNIPVLLLTSLYGTSVTGLFGLANSIINLPTSLIGASVAQVFYSEVAKIGKSNPQEIKRLAVKLIKKMAIIGSVPMVTLMLFGPILFSFVFGNEWYEAGIYARILSVMVYFFFIILPIGKLLEVFERQRESLFFNIARLIVILLVFLIVKMLGLNSYQAVVLFSISNSIINITMLVFVMRIVNLEIKNLER